MEYPSHGQNPSKSLRERLKDINMGWGYKLTELDQILLSFIGQNFEIFYTQYKLRSNKFYLCF